MSYMIWRVRKTHFNATDFDPCNVFFHHKENADREATLRNIDAEPGVSYETGLIYYEDSAYDNEEDE